MGNRMRRKQPLSRSSSPCRVSEGRLAPAELLLDTRIAEPNHGCRRLRQWMLDGGPTEDAAEQG